MQQQRSRPGRNIRPDTIAGLVALVGIIVLWAMSIKQVRTPILIAAGLITHTHTPTITQTPTVTPTPTITPTLMAITLSSEPFSEDETGVVLASFNYDASLTSVMQKNLYHAFTAHELDVLRLDKTIPDESQALLIGQQYRASAVVWGREYDGTKYVYLYIMPDIVTQAMTADYIDYDWFIIKPNDAEYFTNYMVGLLAYKGQEDYITAIAYWDRAVELAEAGQYADEENADGQTYYRALHSLYFYRGTAHLFVEQYQAAIGDLTISHTFYPEDFHLLFNRGLAHDALNHELEALADYTAALEFNPDDADLHEVRGDLHYRMGNEGAAVADYLRYEQLTGELEPHMEERLSEMGLR